MLEEEIAGREIRKTDVRRELRAGGLANRSEGSIEYRMQNISSVLQSMGRDWVAGYKPAGNVGPTNTAIIKQKIEELTRNTAYLPRARSGTLRDVVPSRDQLMGVKAVYRPISSYVLCFGGRGSPNSGAYYSVPAGAAKKVAVSPFVITIGGGQNVTDQYDGRAIDLAQLSPVYGPTSILLEDPDEIARLAQWPVAIAIREVWRFSGSPRLVEDLGLEDKTILSGSQDGIIRPRQIDQLYEALSDIALEHAVLPAAANFYDDGTPRLIGAIRPSIPKRAKEEGKRYWRLQQRTERDAGLSREAKRLNELQHGSFTCEACEFKSADAAMLDAHHPTPLAVGTRTTFAEHLEILCPTCHRKAHRTDDRLKPLNLVELKKWAAAGRP